MIRPWTWKYDWAEIQRFYDLGNTAEDCRGRFGISRSTFSKAVRKGRIRRRTQEIIEAKRRRGMSRDHLRTTRYDWTEIQRYYDLGNSVRVCCRRFGFAMSTWTFAVRRGDVRPRPRLCLEALLASSKSRRNIKKRLLEAGILENRCAFCGLSEWRGQPLCIQIDHANGNGKDYRLENLRMLCPNCHSQTETFGARNRKLKRQQVSFLVTERKRSRIAQLVERQTLNLEVLGSSPSPGARPYRLEA